MSCGGFFIELMMHHRIEMCGADARRFARRTFRRYDEVKRFFTFAQDDVEKTSRTKNQSSPRIDPHGAETIGKMVFYFKCMMGDDRKK